MALISRDYDNVRLTGFVRTVPQRTEAILNRWLPDTLVGTRTFRVRTVERPNDAAVYRAFDAPSPVVAREGYTEKVGAIPPISEMMAIGEDERLGIYERTVRGDFDDEVEGEIFNDAARLVRRIQNRLEIARGQLLQTGTVPISENGLTALVADFGLPAGNSFAAPGGTWGPASDIIGDLRSMNEQSITDNGTPLGAFIVSTAAINSMVTNAGLRDLLSNNGVNPSLVSEADLQRVLGAFSLPPFIRYDYKVGGTDVITPTNVIGVPNPDADEFGRTEWGTTAEALELALARGEAPGMVGLVMRDEDPVAVYTKVAALAMPVLNDARLLYVMDIT